MSGNKCDAGANSHSISSEAGTRAGGDAETKGIAEVVTAVTALLSAAGGMKMILEMVKLWVEQRKERSIKLKSGDIELELQGYMSQKELQQKIELFREMARNANETEIKIIAP